jgi:hypothetical protein
VILGSVGVQDPAESVIDQRVFM